MAEQSQSRGWMYIEIPTQVLMWAFLFAYLLVDVVNGFLVQQLSIDIKLAQLYKTGLTFFGLYVLISWRSVTVIPLISGFAIMLLGPLSRFTTQTDTTFFLVELPSVTRVLLLFTALCFTWESFQRYPELSKYWSKLTLKVGAILLLLNVLSGYAGIGFSTYDSTGVGFKGFFKAGNELSAVFGLLCTFVLHEIWNKRGILLYFIASLLFIFVGVSIATKAAVLFALLATLFIPLLNLRERLFSPLVITWFIGALFILGALGFWIIDLLSELPFFQRVLYVFDTLGVWGVLLSKRDELVEIYIQELLAGNVTLGLLTGIGSEALMFQRGRLYVELDPIDVTMYFGIVITLVYFLFTFLSIYLPLKRIKEAYYAPCVLLANICFLFFAIIAGHVWISGLLAGIWGVYFSMLNVRIEEDTSA